MTEELIAPLVEVDGNSEGTESFNLEEEEAEEVEMTKEGNRNEDTVETAMDFANENRFRLPLKAPRL